MSSDAIQNSIFLISCIDHSDMIFVVSKKGNKTFYSFLSKILLLSVCSYLCLHIQTFVLSLTQVNKFVVEFCACYKTDKFTIRKNKQNILRVPDLRLSPFQGCEIIPRYCSLSNNFLFIPHQYQMQESCQHFLSSWFKLKSRVSHDWVEGPLNGSY